MSSENYKSSISCSVKAGERLFRCVPWSHRRWTSIWLAYSVPSLLAAHARICSDVTPRQKPVQGNSWSSMGHLISAGLVCASTCASAGACGKSVCQGHHCCATVFCSKLAKNNPTNAHPAVGGFFGFPMAGALFVLEIPHRMGLQYFESHAHYR